MIRFHRLSASFVRGGLAAVSFLFAGGCGFVISAILSAIIVGVLFSAFSSSGPIEAINRSFETHPWGVAARLVVGGEGIGLHAGGWLAWRVSGGLFRAVPQAMQRAYTAALILFLCLETAMIGATLPSALRLALEGHVTEGQICELFSHSHGTVSYTYTVSGRRFKAVGSPEHFEAIHPGSTVPVYYVASQPDVSILHEPRRAMLDSVLNNLAVGIFLCVMPFALAAVRELASSRLEAERRAQSS